MSVVDSFLNERKHFLAVAHVFLSQPIDVDTFIYVLSNRQVDGRRLQQVHDLLVVNLKEAALHQELQHSSIILIFYLLCFLPNAVENVFKRSLHYASLLARFISQHFVSFAAWALDRVRLSCARLSVCKNCAVVSLQAFIGDWLCDLVEDVGLICVLVSHQIKTEIKSSSLMLYGNLLVGTERNTFLSCVTVIRSYSYSDDNVAFRLVFSCT